MKLKRYLLRYYPPGIILEYEQGGDTKNKTLDLLDLTPETNTEEIILDISVKEPLITEKRRPQIRELIEKLKCKLSTPAKTKFSPFKVLRAHILPLTNVAFNKSGSHFITGSYDRTCKLWHTESGKEVHTFEGHGNVVYAIGFNIPFSDKIATGSFDKTARLWSADTGECHHIFRGHTAEVVCLQFNPASNLLATGSMDTLTKVWDVETGYEVASLSGHTAEVIALQFAQSPLPIVMTTKATELLQRRLVAGDGGNGVDKDELDEEDISQAAADGLNLGYQSFGAGDMRLLLTGSFDHTVCLWDLRSGERVHQLIGHGAEIAAATFAYDARHVATASMDKTVRVWDTRMGRQTALLSGHTDEVLDVTYDAVGRRLASASADGTARIWDTYLSATAAAAAANDDDKDASSTAVNASFGGKEPASFKLIACLTGHEGEVSKVCFNARGTLLLTASADKTARLWDAETGEARDVLVGHTDEIFSCAFNYEADCVITGSKDNTCRVWQ